MFDRDQRAGRRQAGPAWAAAAMVAGCALLVGSSTSSHDPAPAQAARPESAVTSQPSRSASATPSTPMPSGDPVVQDQYPQPMQQQPAPVDPGGGLIAKSALPLPPGASSGIGPGGDVSGGGPVSGTGANGIPAVALAAYRRAAHAADLANPGCNLDWTLLAAIGRVESDHGQFGGAQLLADGLSSLPIIGPPLNGHGTARILDTDNGRLDGDNVYDHAVGPMQFIPSTWASWAADGDGDGVANPFDINDATLAAARYLCAAGGDLATHAGEVHAVFAYNPTSYYVRLVLAYAALYAGLNPGPFPLPPLAPGPSHSPTPTAPHSSQPPSGPRTAHPSPAPSVPLLPPLPSSHPSPTRTTSATPTQTHPASSPAPSTTTTSRSASTSPSSSRTPTTSRATTSCPAPTSSSTPTTSSHAAVSSSGSAASAASKTSGSATGPRAANTTSSRSSSASGCAGPSQPQPTPSTASAGVTGVAGFIVLGLALVVAGTVARRRTARQH